MAHLSKTQYPFRTVAFALACCATLALQGFSYQQPEGETLFKKNCARCHGPAGDRGLLGAKNLKVSVLSDEAIVRQIKEGKGFMPSFKKKLSADDLTKLVAYVKGLRTNTTK